MSLRLKWNMFFRLHGVFLWSKVCSDDNLQPQNDNTPPHPPGLPFGLFVTSHSHLQDRFSERVCSRQIHLFPSEDCNLFKKRELKLYTVIHCSRNGVSYSYTYSQYCGDLQAEHPSPPLPL